MTSDLIHCCHKEGHVFVIGQNNCKACGVAWDPKDHIEAIHNIQSMIFNEEVLNMRIPSANELKRLFNSK